MKITRIKVSAIIILALGFFLGLYEVFGTNRFIRSSSVTLSVDHNNDVVASYARATPHGSVWGRWFIEVRPLNGNPECNSGQWRTAYYQDEVVVDGEVVSSRDEQVLVSIKIPGAWVNQCLTEANLPFDFTITRQARLFGFLYLHPDTRHQLIETFTLGDQSP